VAGNGDLVATGEFDGEVVIARVDSEGTPVWARTVGGAADDEGSSIIRMGGGFLVLGNTQSFEAGNQDLWLIRIDDSGTVLWTKTFGGTGGSEGSTGIIYRQTLSASSDGGAIVATNSSSPPLEDRVPVVLKIDAAGSLEWANAYPLGAGLASAVAEFAGGYRVFGTIQDEFQMAITHTGAFQWARVYGPDFYPNYLDGDVTSDGGGVLFTESHTFPVEDPDSNHWFRLVKTDREGRTHGCCDETNLAVTEVPLPFPLVLETGYETGVAPNSFVVDTLVPVPLAMKALTHCQSLDDFLCGGIVKGECLCPQ
jgi:hypothetical protein